MPKVNPTALYLKSFIQQIAYHRRLQPCKSLLITLIGIFISLSSGQNWSEELIEHYAFDTDSPRSVITPTRLKQAIKDSPHSVSVITEEMLKSLGIRTVLEAMRLIPGFLIDYRHTSPTHASASYHGTNALSAKRMNLMINGRPLYRPALSQIFWETLPVNIEEIRRIEVVRGPASATYGANSFLAVINIITKPPLEQENQISVQGDTNASHSARLSYAHTFNDTGLSLQASREFDPGPDATSNYPGEFPSDLTKDYFSLSTNTAINTNSNLFFDYRYADTFRQVDFIDEFQTSYPDIGYQDHYFAGKYEYTHKHSYFSLSYAYMDSESRQDWNTCLPALALLDETTELFTNRPSVVADLLLGQPTDLESSADIAALEPLNTRTTDLGITPETQVCGTTNNDYDESTSLVEFESRYSTHRLQIGSLLSFRRDEAESKTYFDGERSQDIFNASVNLAWLPNDKITLNIGGNYEKTDFFSGLFSPRFSLNYHANQSSTVRYTYSKAIRTPDMWEQSVNWKYRLYDSQSPDVNIDDPTFYIQANSPGDIEEERILSQELAYHGIFLNQSLRIDIKLFKDRLTNLLSQELELISFQPENNGELDLKGIELESHYYIRPDTAVYLGLAYLENNSNIDIERTLHAEHSGFAAISQALGEQINLSAAFYFATDNEAEEFDSAYQRFDLHLQHRSRNQPSLKTALTGSYWPNRAHEVVTSIDTGYQVHQLDYDEKYRITLTLGLEF